MRIVTPQQYREENKTIPSLDRNEKIDQTVLDIIMDVRTDGDRALFQYTKQLDGVQLESLIVTKEELDEAMQVVDHKLIDALRRAKENIVEFHEKQKETSWFFEQEEGVMLGQKVTPLEKAGVYIPGGKAAYPSTVLMNVIPAKLAGVKSISIVTPPDDQGQVNAHVLAAAQIAGVDRIYKVGGAQAIAALAYGTESIKKVDKIVGPGNIYVARAKKWVYGDVAIDMIAGPSEICVVADETANPRYVAADLLSQAEHDEDASSICITTDRNQAERIKEEVRLQATSLERKSIIQASLEKNGRMIVTDTLKEALQLANEIAPEHLQLMVKNPAEKLSSLQHAGAIFLGNYSPEPLGDYFAGPNHTLPTSGTAVFSSPLGVYDFMKKSSIIHYSKEALQKAAEPIVTLAQAEGLTAHARSITIRKDDEDA
ncbi:MAG TPA: histidinol dehydrogenase [Bacillota bacterium]